MYDWKNDFKYLPGYVRPMYACILELTTMKIFISCENNLKFEFLYISSLYYYAIIFRMVTFL